jgi:crossover junction endodeoxyribonuclease RusA
MSAEYTIRLPWPSPTLSSNARPHWAQKHRATKAARKTAWALAKQVKASGDTLEFTYHPPHNKYDVQNIAGMLKASIDGIADAMGVDDKHLTCVFPSEFAEVVKGGCVLVHIKPLPESDNWQSIGSLAQKMVRGSIE